MKRYLVYVFVFFCFLPSVSGQQLINNKGNRNQSYPVITEKNPEIVNLINLVSQDSIESHIRYMQQFLRGAKTPAALIVQNWLVDNFESYGYERVNDISIHYFYHDYQQLAAGNVVVVKKGSEFPDEYILVTSHYDHPSGPGADDNASGTAGVLECARLLKNFPTKRSIMFVPFNAEELWMVGSMPFAQNCADNDMNIIAHFNMDMIGWFPPDSTKTIMASGYSYISESLFKFYQQTANTYIPEIPTIRLSDGDSYGGDHMPFNVYEYPSLYIGDIEYHKQHPCYHGSCDTIGPKGGVNRLDLAKAFVQATLSAIAELANAWLPPQNLSARTGIDKITVSWDANKESLSYKIYKNNKFLNETTKTFYEDFEVEVGKKYEYYVIAFNNEKQTAPSNKDVVTFVKPLQLPYFNDFKTDKYGFGQSDWVLRSMGGKSSICNTNNDGYFYDNYLSIAELNWFPIPDDIENISIRFKYQGNILGIWIYSTFGLWNNAGLWFEVTNDRKTWHKLAFITSFVSSWEEYKFSLNDYKNSEFFQARFRLESSGSSRYGPYSKIGYITDFEINFESDTTSVKEPVSYISSFHFSPNPASNFINITTNQQEPYHVAVYDMAGKLIFAKEEFTDGALCVAQLNAGNYLLAVSTKQHRVAKKLVIR